MSEISCKLLIIGGGPGGYVCGIRAGQLGIDTVLVEKTRLGGTCLNVGCIPSKALIHAADEFHHLSVFASKGALGITAQNPAIDFAQTLEWKDGIVNRLNGGVAGLLKRSRVRMFHGQARFLDGKTVLVETDTGRQTIHAENIVIATGSVRLKFRRCHLAEKSFRPPKRCRWTKSRKSLPLSAAAISGWKSARPSPSLVQRSPWSKQPTASCRNMMRN